MIGLIKSTFNLSSQNDLDLIIDYMLKIFTSSSLLKEWTFLKIILTFNDLLHLAPSYDYLESIFNLLQKVF